MKETSKYKKLLAVELAKLESELSTIAIKDENGDWIAKKNPEDTDVDESDRDTVADGIEEYETNIAVLDDLETRYQEVNEALERIEIGKYGICSKCGKEIDEKRLTANPAAKSCVKCAK